MINKMKISKNKLISISTCICLAFLTLSCTTPVVTGNETNNVQAHDTKIIKVSDHGAELNFNINLNNFSVKDNSNSGVAAPTAANINKYLVYLLANENSAGYPSGGDPLTDKVAGPFTVTASGMTNIRLTGIPESPVGKYYYIAVRAQNAANADLIKPDNGDTAWGGTSAGQPIAVSSGAGITVSSTLVVSSPATLTTTIRLIDGQGAGIEGKITSSLNVSPTISTIATNAFEKDILFQAEVSNPYDLAVDSEGNTYIADYGGNAIKKLDTQGNLTTLVRRIDRPRALCVYGNAIYFVENVSGIYKIFTDGTGLTSLPTTGGSTVAYGITTDGTYLYFTDVSHIKKVPINGGTITNILTDPSSITNIRVSGSDLYYTYANTIKKVSTDGTGAATVITGLNGLFGLALSGSDIYFSEYDGNAIKKVPMIGGTPTNVVSSGLSGPQGITISGSDLYIADSGNNAIKKVPTSGSPVTTLVSAQMGSPSKIALYGTDIYFADTNNNDIKKVPMAGGNPTTVIPSSLGLSSPIAIAVSDTDLFISDGDGTGSNAIKKVPINGGTITTLISGTTRANDMIVYDNDLYFVDSNSNTIKKISVNGGTVTTLVNFSSGPGIFLPYGLTISGNYIYIADRVKGIVKAPITGGSYEIVPVNASAAVNVQNIEAYDDELYFTSGAIIRKVPITGGTAANITTSIFVQGLAIDSSTGKLYFSSSADSYIGVLK